MDLTPAEKRRITTSLNVVNRYATEGDQEQFGNIIRDLRVVLRESTGEKREQLNKELLELNKRRSLMGVRSNLDSLFKKYELTTGQEVSTTGSESESTDSDNFPSLDEQEEEKAEPTTAKPVKKIQRKKLDLGGTGAGADSGDKYLPPKPPSSTILPKPKQPAPSQTKTPRLRGKAKPPPKPTIPPKPKQPARAQTKAPAQTISSTDSEESSEESSSEDYTDDEPTPMMEQPDPSQTPAPAPAPPPPPPPPPVEELAKVDLKVDKPKVSKIDDQLSLDPGVNPPSKKMGKSLDDLSVEEINKDLDYFYSTFGNRLKKLKRISSKNIEVLKRFYKRVLALLRVEDKEPSKQIGIIIKGSDFIKDKLKEIILENSINGLTAKDLLINIEGDEDKDKADAGKYEFKVNPSTGKKYAQGEPVDRLIPTQEETRVAEVHSDHTASSYKKKPSRLQMPKTMFRNNVVTARKMVNNNPFLNARQPSIKLKTIY
jgi:hypothetical protein